MYVTVTPHILQLDVFIHYYLLFSFVVAMLCLLLVYVLLCSLRLWNKSRNMWRCFVNESSFFTNKQEVCRLNEETYLYFTLQNKTECRTLRLAEVMFNGLSARPEGTDSH